LQTVLIGRVKLSATRAFSESTPCKKRDSNSRESNKANELDKEYYHGLTQQRQLIRTDEIGKAIPEMA